MSRHATGKNSRQHSHPDAFLPRMRKRFFTECQLMTRGRSLRRSGVTRRTCQATACRHIQALPAHHLRAPGQVGIFAKGKEFLIEELTLHRNGFDEFATEHRGCPAGAEHILWPIVLASVGFLGAAIEVAHVTREIDSGGVDDVGSVLFGERSSSAIVFRKGSPRPNVLPLLQPIWRTKSGLSTTSGLRHSTHSPPAARIAWFCPPANPTFARLWITRH